MNRNIKLKTVLAAFGALILLGGTFFAGMAYENHRISSAMQEAFSGLGDDTTDASVEGEDVDVEGEDEGGSYGAPIPLGETTTWAPNDEEQWDVTLNKLECGLETIPNAVQNYDYDYDNPEDEYTDATPEDGETFCVATSTWVNSGKSEATLENYTTMSDLVTDDGTEYAATDTDGEYTDAINDGLTKGLNPGKSTEVQNVYSIETGLPITGIALKPYEMMSEVQPLLFAAN